jgi:hypothetical protein
MPSRTLEEIIEEVKTLSADEQRQLREALEKDERTAELRKIQSKYAHMQTSSEAFAARKAEEIALEDRR